MAIHRKSYTWPRVRYALSRLAERETGLSSDAPAGTNDGGIAWVDDDQGPLAKPYVSVQKVSARNSGFANTYQRECVTEQRVTITQTTVGEFVILDLIWSEVRTTVVGGDSLTDTRDKFLTACQARVAETQEPLLLASDGAADILVTAKVYAIPDIEAVLGLTVAPESVEDLKVKSVTRLYRVRIQFYGFDPNGEDSSDEFVSELQTSLETSEGLEFLEPYGVGVQDGPSTAIDATVVSGPLREHRDFFDTTVVARRTTYDSRGVDHIDSVDPPAIEGAFV